MIIQLSEGTLKTKYGTYREYLYYDGQQETIALVMGDVKEAQGVLCRVHSSCMAAHAYETAGFQRDARDFRPAAEILQDLGGKSIRMITNNAGKVETLTRYGVGLGTQGTG